jgi:hypothetical protein
VPSGIWQTVKPDGAKEKWMHSPGEKPIQIGEDGLPKGYKRLSNRINKKVVTASDHHYGKFKQFQPQ